VPCSKSKVGEVPGSKRCFIRDPPRVGQIEDRIRLNVALGRMTAEALASSGR
jgi:hypothetical protein